METEADPPLCQFELDRRARIAENKRRMIELFGYDPSDQSRPEKKKPRAPTQKKIRTRVEESEKRRSNRFSNKPSPLYYIHDDATDGTRKRHRLSTGPRASQGHRCHGRSAAAGQEGASTDDLFLVAPKGWKSELSCASVKAAEAATAAAVAKQAELQALGRLSFVKLMSASQVSGGFWMQLPLGLVPHYKGSQRYIRLHCFDKQHQQPRQSLLYADGDSGTKWAVVYLPKGGEDSAGLSGGWRGFAIDQRLYPNDTVLFEVLDDAPQGRSSSNTNGSNSGTAAAGAGTSAARHGDTSDGNGGDTSGSSSSDAAAKLPAGAAAALTAVGRVAPGNRLHMLAHIFRAHQYMPVPPQPEPSSGGSGGQADEDAQPDGAPSASGAESDDKDDDCLVDDSEEELEEVCLAEQQRARRDDDTLAESDQDKQQLEQELKESRQQHQLAIAEQEAALRLQQPQVGLAGIRDEAELLKAAEAGQLRGLRIGSLQPAAASEAEDTRARAAATPAGAAGGGPARKRGHVAASSGKQKRQAAAAAAEAGGRRVSGRVRRPKLFYDEDMAAAAAAGGGGAAAALVPKPASPDQFVAPPTEEETRRNAAGGPFYVRQILGHRVSDGVDKFLVSWAGFGSWWDSWEEGGNLDAPPATYSWRGGRAAIPAKFRA